MTRPVPGRGVFVFATRCRPRRRHFRFRFVVFRILVVLVVMVPPSGVSYHFPQTVQAVNVGGQALLTVGQLPQGSAGAGGRDQVWPLTQFFSVSFL